MSNNVENFVGIKYCYLHVDLLCTANLGIFSKVDGSDIKIEVYIMEEIMEIRGEE